MNYDIIGDVHGCYDELLLLLEQLGYTSNTSPSGRKLVFVGDLVNNGPKSVSVLKLVMELVENDLALMVLGNHDWELKRILQGKQSCSAKYRRVVRQIRLVSPTFAADVVKFLKAQPKHLELDGDLLVVHGAYREGLSSKAARQLALFGETDASGMRIEDWARQYAGKFKTIVRGHRVVPEVTVIKAKSGTRVYNVDTGCASGGKLSALQFPEIEVVQVQAESAYVRRNWRLVQRRVPGHAKLMAA
jgi:hypothetical protein